MSCSVVIQFLQRVSSVRKGGIAVTNTNKKPSVSKRPGFIPQCADDDAGDGLDVDGRRCLTVAQLKEDIYRETNIPPLRQVPACLPAI